MSKFLKKVIITGFLSLFLLFIIIVSILWTYSNKLPDYKYLKSYKPPVSSKLYSGKGILVSDFPQKKEYSYPITLYQKR